VVIGPISRFSTGFGFSPNFVRPENIVDMCENIFLDSVFVFSLSVMGNCSFIISEYSLFFSGSGFGAVSIFCSSFISCCSGVLSPVRR
jgi:hypothetical protein